MYNLPHHVAAIQALVLARHNSSVACAIEQLSSSGASLVGPLTSSPDDRIQILFDVDGCPVEVCATVVRVEHLDILTDRIDVSFIGLSDSTRALIAQLQDAASSRDT